MWHFSIRSKPVLESQSPRMTKCQSGRNLRILGPMVPSCKWGNYSTVTKRKRSDADADDENNWLLLNTVHQPLFQCSLVLTHYILMARHSTVPNCAQLQGHSAPCVLFERCLSQLRDLAILTTNAREGRDTHWLACPAPFLPLSDDTVVFLWWTIAYSFPMAAVNKLPQI